MSVIYDQGQAPWKGGPNDQTGSRFGDQDIIANNNAGVSYAKQLAFYESNPNRQGGGGIGGGVHAKLVAGAAAERARSAGGGGGGGYSAGSIGAGAGAFNPGSVNFNPGGIDMGGGPSWSDSDFTAGLARERSQEYITNGTSTENNSITNDIEQNIGNKGDWETNIGDNNTINNSSLGNDYSLNLGSLNVANRIN